MAQMDLKVINIKKIEEMQVNNQDKEYYQLVARDAAGTNKITIRSVNEFNGFTTDQIISVDLKNAQTSLTDFNKAEEELKKAKKAKED